MKYRKVNLCKAQWRVWVPPSPFWVVLPSPPLGGVAFSFSSFWVVLPYGWCCSPLSCIFWVLVLPSPLRSSLVVFLSLFLLKGGAAVPLLVEGAALGGAAFPSFSGVVLLSLLGGVAISSILVGGAALACFGVVGLSSPRSSVCVRVCADVGWCRCGWV